MKMISSVKYSSTGWIWMTVRTYALFSILPKPGAHMSDALMQALQAGEESRLLRFFRRRLGTGEDARDATQETYLRMLEIPSASGIANPQAYLFQVAKSVAHLTLTRRRREQGLFTDETNAVDAPCDLPSPERIVDGRQSLLAMAHAIEVLPARCQQVFILSRIHGLANGDIAERLGISRNMVEKHIIKALMHCRQVRSHLLDR
jgi:RNA polymerase sigma-70 factor (ECF subfamily)